MPGMRPLVSPPIAPDDTFARVDSIHAGSDATKDPGYLGVLGQLEGMLGDVDARPGPALESVPGSPSPLAAMAAAFSGGLAEFLGQRGASQAAREGIAQAAEAPRQAEARNRQAQMLDLAQRQKDRLQIMLQIGELKAEAAKENREMDEWLKQTKTNFLLEEKLKKLDLEKEEVKAAQRINLERVKGEERRTTNAARTRLQTLVDSGDAEARVIRDEADAKADAATRRSRAMRKANEAAFGAEIFEESEIRIQEAKEQIEIDRIYDEALAKTRGVAPKKEKRDIQAPADTDLDSFFKP